MKNTSDSVMHFLFQILAQEFYYVLSKEIKQNIFGLVKKILSLGNKRKGYFPVLSKARYVTFQSPNFLNYKYSD